jgi:hypothetical protein
MSFGCESNGPTGLSGLVPLPPGRPALIKLRVAGDSVLRRPRMPLVIPAIGIRAALRRSPPRITILAPILTREHAYDDEEADDRQQSEHEKGGG